MASRAEVNARATPATEDPAVGDRDNLAGADRPVRCVLMDADAQERRQFRLMARECARLYSFTETETVEETVEMLRAERPDVCIAAASAGDHSELATLVSSDPDLATIPVIVIADAPGEAAAVAAIRSGATDYISRPGLTAARLERATAEAIAHSTRRGSQSARIAALSEENAILREGTLTELGRLKTDVLRLLGQSWKLIDAGEGATPAARGDLSRLTRAALATIDDLTLDASVGARALPSETVSLDALLRESLDPLKEAVLARGAQVRSAPLPEARGVRAHFRLLFEQLTLHGLRFSRLGLKPLMEFGGGVARDGSWTLWYRDSGISLAARIQNDSRVFDADTSETPAGEAELPAVYGLSLCQRIVERAGGRMSIFGEADGGCRIVMRFASAAAGAGRTEPKAEEAGTAREDLASLAAAIPNGAAGAGSAGTVS